MTIGLHSFLLAFPLSELVRAISPIIRLPENTKPVIYECTCRMYLGMVFCRIPKVSYCDLYLTFDVP